MANSYFTGEFNEASGSVTIRGSTAGAEWTNPAIVKAQTLQSAGQLVVSSAGTTLSGLSVASQGAGKWWINLTSN